MYITKSSVKKEHFKGKERYYENRTLVKDGIRECVL